MVEHLFKFSVFILLFLQCVLTFAESNNTKNDTSAGVIATTKAEEVCNMLLKKFVLLKEVGRQCS